jgi:3-hydroxybutyryl-CoA dehydrogenase
MSSIKSLGILGAGQMGAGIAQVACTVAKLPVLLWDQNKEFLREQIRGIDENLKRIVAKGALHDGDRHEAMQRIRAVDEMEELQECDFVIEAVTEDFGIKSRVLNALRVNPSTIVASNTSSIPITKLASISQHSSSTWTPNHFIGMHFMNPVPQMRLVEVITGEGTSEETFKLTKELAERMGKIVTRSRDVPGFIANRLLMPYINEAIFALHEVVIDDHV